MGKLRRPREREESVAGWGVNWWILTILIVALLVRVLYLLQAREHLFFNGLSDSLYYHQWAVHIIKGQVWSPVFYMSPLFPYLLAIFYKAFGPRPELIQWFQVLLGSASCGLIYFLGRLAFGRAVGLLAAFMGALYVVEIFYEGALLVTATLYFLNLLVLVSILWALRQNRWYLWIIPGLLLGLSALGRANVLAFLPLLIVGIFLLEMDSGKKGGRRTAVALGMLLGILVVLMPVTLHNLVVGHDLVFITSNLGLNFFVGNNVDAIGYYDKPKGMDLSSDLNGTKIASFLKGKALKPSEVSHFWFQKGLDFVKAQPGKFLKLTLTKLLFFWNAYEIPQVEHLDFSKQHVPVLRWPLLNFSILGPLGLLGMALSLRRWRVTYFLLAFIVSLMGATVLFFVLSRFRLQVCSVLMIFAAYALMWLWRKLRSRKIQQLTAAILALAVLALLVNWPHPALNSARDVAKSHNFLALKLWEEGDLQGASREYERAKVIYAQLGETYVSLGNLRFEQGRIEEAADLYKEALRINPKVSAVHLNLGNFFALRGMWDRAIQEYRAEIKVSPYDLRAYESLSRAMKVKQKLKGGQSPQQ